MKFISLIMLAAFIGVMFGRMENRDMKVCQLSHSHDVCFQALNR